MSSVGRVLIATTDAALLETIGFMLIDEGYNVVLAWSGSVAQHRVTTFHPSLIILDAMFQIGDQLALEACRKSLSPQTPIIAIGSSEHLRMMATELGASDVLLRPLDKATLVACVEKYMSAASA